MTAALRASATTYGYLRCCNLLEQNGCDAGSVRVEPVEAYVLKQVKALIAQPKRYRAWAEAQNENDGEERLATLEAELADVAKQRERLLTQYLRGNVPENLYEREAKRLDSLEAEVAVERQRIQQWRRRADQIATSLEDLQEIVDTLDDLHDEQLNSLYHQLIEEIDIERGKDPVIHWY